MYFNHRFPLTSYIRGHLLYYEMALLHPSIDTKHVGTQNDIMDWSFLKSIDENNPKCTLFPSALLMFLMIFILHSRLFSLQVVSHSRVAPYVTCEWMVKCCIHRFSSQELWPIHEILVYAPAITLRQNLKNKSWLFKGSWAWNYNSPNHPRPCNSSSSTSINRGEG